MPKQSGHHEHPQRTSTREGTQLFALVEKDNLDRLISINSAEKGGRYYHLFTGEEVYPRLFHRSCPSFVRMPGASDRDTVPLHREERRGGEGIAHVLAKLEIVKQRKLLVLIGTERVELQLGDVSAEARLPKPNNMWRVDLTASVEGPSELKERLNKRVHIEIICSHHPGPEKLQILRSTESGLVIISMMPWVINKIEEQHQNYIDHNRPINEEAIQNWRRMVRWSLREKNLAVVRHIPGEGDPAVVTMRHPTSTSCPPVPSEALSQLRMPSRYQAGHPIQPLPRPTPEATAILASDDQKALSPAKQSAATSPAKIESASIQPTGDLLPATHKGTGAAPEVSATPSGISPSTTVAPSPLSALAAPAFQVSSTSDQSPQPVRNERRKGFLESLWNALFGELPPQ